MNLKLTTVTHERGSLRLGHVAQVWCVGCGWRTEVHGRSGDETSERVRKAYDDHLTIPVLSLHQPWASLVALGVKTIETRSWQTNYRGPLAIHAAQQRPSQSSRVGDFYVDWGRDPALGGFTNGGFDEGYGFLLVDSSRTEFNDDGTSRPLAADAYMPLHLGAIVATCTLVDVVPITAPATCEWDSEYEPEVAPSAHAAIDGQVTLHNVAGWRTMVTMDLPYGDYTPGRFAWVLQNVEPLAEPVQFKGGQGLTKRWEPTP